MMASEHTYPIKPDEFQSLDRNELKLQLSVFFKSLLLNDFGRLLQLMYRHDVDEHLFNLAMKAESTQLQAEKISDLVIDRELKKIATRNKYRSEKKQSVNTK